jgi:hypothetical protein
MSGSDVTEGRASDQHQNFNKSRQTGQAANEAMLGIPDKEIPKKK